MVTVVLSGVDAVEAVVKTFFAATLGGWYVVRLQRSEGAPQGIHSQHLHYSFFHQAAAAAAVVAPPQC
ncbi:unnamed protein product [Linum trigynum]|uniref:Secreted protein n=1 Tax=Linum trigynum TaxID=586398 RepID=A0AAV2F3U4_9ROSI